MSEAIKVAAVCAVWLTAIVAAAHLALAGHTWFGLFVLVGGLACGYSSTRSGESLQ